MGQIPKTIIYAAAGTKLKFNIDGKDVELDENSIDSMAAEEGDKLVKSGELKQSDLPKFMSTYATFKNQAKAGKYNIDTAGPNALVSMGYSQPGSELMGIKSKADLGFNEKGEVAQRTGFGRFLARQGLQSAIKPKEQDMMARLNNVLGARIGGMSLGEDAKAQKVADDLKIKTDAEAKTAAEAEKLKWQRAPRLDEAFNKQVGAGTEDWGVISDLPESEKLAVLAKNADEIYANRDKYEDVKGKDWSFLEKYRDPTTHEFNKNVDFYKDFYSHMYADKGRDAINKIFKVTPAETPKTKEEVEAQQIQTNTAWNKLQNNKFIQKLSDNEYFLPSSDVPLYTGSTATMGTHYRKDPTTGKIQISYSTIDKGGPANVSNPSAISPLMDSLKNMKIEPLEVAGKRHTFKIRPTQVEGKDVLEEEGNPSNTRFLSDGGVLRFQDGGVARALKFAETYQGEPNTSTTQSDASMDTNVPTGSSTTSNANAKSTVESALSKPLSSSHTLKVANMLDFHGYSDSDVEDAASLGLDLGGLVAGLIPGGSAVAGGMGLASTTASLDATRRKKGGNWSDLGWQDWGSAAVSGTLDAATMIPYLGELAQSAKVVKNLPKIGRLLQVAGTASGLASIGILGRDLLSGDKKFSDFTTDDLKLMVTGLRLVSAGNTYRRAIKSGTPDEISGKVLTADKQQVVPATLIKDEKGNWIPKNAAFKDDKVLQEYSKFGFGKPRVIGSDAPIITPKETPRASISEEGIVQPWFSKIGTGAQRANVLRSKAGKTSVVNPEPTATAPKTAPTEAAPTAPKETVVETPKDVVEKVVTRRGTQDRFAQAKKIDDYKGNKEVDKFAREVIGAVKSTPLALPSRRVQTVVAPKPPARVPKSPKVEVSKAEAFQKASKKATKDTSKKTQSNRNGGIILFAQNGIVIPDWLKSAEQQTVYNPKQPPEERPKELGVPRNPRYIANTLIPGLVKSKAPLNATIGTPKLPGADLKEQLARSTRATAAGGFLPEMQGRLTPQKVVSNALSKGITPKVAIAGGPDASSNFLQKLQTGFSGKQGVQASEFARTLLANKATQNLDTRVEAPLVQAAAETPIAVRGDLATKASFYDRANKVRASFVPGPDPVRNAMMKNQIEQQASQIEAQGDQADAQMKQTTQGQATEGAMKNAAARAEVAARNTASLSSKIQGERQGENAKQSQIANNWDSFLASQNLEKKTDINRKLDLDKEYRTRNLQRTLDTKYPNLAWRAYQARSTPGGITPELSSDLQKYQDELDAGSRAIAFSKDGGSIEKEQNKANLALYKSRSKYDVFDSQIGNKWNAKKGEAADKFSLVASKRITDYITKILK